MFQEKSSSGEDVKRAGRFVKSQKEGKKDPLTALQNFGRAEMERKRKADEDAKKKKKSGVTTEPEKGFLQRMYEKYVGGSK